MANNGSYGNERPITSDIDFATDPASGGFFNSDYKKLVICHIYVNHRDFRLL